MDTRSPEFKFPFYAKISGVLISLVILVYGLHALKGVLIPLVFAILFSVLLFPLVQHLNNVLPVVSDMERTKQRIRMNGHFKNLDPLNF